MKKIITIVFFLFISFSTVFATNIGKISINKTDFSANCFEYYSEIKSGSFQENEVFSYSSIYDNPTFIQGEYLLPSQYFSIEETPYNYTSKQINNIEYVSDDNSNTSVFIDTSIDKYIELDFGDFIDDKNLIINLDYNADFHNMSYMISADGEKYIEIDEHDFSHYSFQYVRIMFNKNLDSQKEEKIILTELKFLSGNFTYLVQNYSNDTIKLYAHNRCESNFGNLHSSQTLPSNINTKKVSSFFEENPSLVENPESDSDSDGILDKFDNCPIISNPNQQDSNSNGIGDLCADDDNDGIYGDKDNCIHIYNPKQRDSNKNNIGDKCDIKNEILTQSNKTIFIVLLILITIGFGFGIYTMMKKIK